MTVFGKHFAMAVALMAGLMIASANPGFAKDREGWVVIETDHSFGDAVEALNAAIKGEKMGIVTRASASAGAKGRGITIPGNMVVGIYRNDFAVRMLEASIDAGIEAPIRMYLSENPNGKTRLAYRTPSTVFAPYMDEGGEKLKAMAAELDGIFDAIAKQASK
ncbi:MAG: DUF302 domain-containing protein [Pseudomonadota bacterium]